MTGILSPLLEFWRMKKAVPWIKGSILDIGCGSGNLLKYLIKEINYLGVDILDEAITKAKKVYPTHKFILLKDVEQFKLSVGKYDTIVVLAVLEHLKNPHSFIMELIDHLEEEGRIIITTPVPFSDKILHFGNKFGLFSQEAHEEHENYFDKSTLSSLISECALKELHYEKFEFGLNQIIIGEI